ncbi:MAG: hypothetical protein ABSG86_32320 [Thermoguttaceae bacterium]
MGQLDRDPMAGHEIGWVGRDIDVERNEQGPLGTCGKRSRREPSLPGVE